MKIPTLFKAYNLKNWQNETEVKGAWVPARPISGYTSPLDCITRRFKLAFGVFIGKYDALTWD